MSDQPGFLIVEPQILVQIDLSQAVLEVCPDARLMTAAAEHAALSRLETVNALEGAIVGLGVQTLKTSGLAREIEARGGWIICIDGRHTGFIRAEGWYVLSRPFSSEHVRDLVGSLLRCDGVLCPSE